MPYERFTRSTNTGTTYTPTYYTWDNSPYRVRMYDPFYNNFFIGSLYVESSDKCDEELGEGDSKLIDEFLSGFALKEPSHKDIGG